MKKILLFIILFSVCIKINATCEESTINALNINAYVNYPYEDGDYAVYIEVEDITEDTYVVIINDYNDERRTYTYENTTDGKIKLFTDNIYEKITYTIKTYTVDNTCNKEYVNKIEVSTTPYNIYSGYNICNNNYNIEECDAFYDSSNISEEDIIDIIDTKIELEERSFLQKTLDYLKEFGLYVLVPLLVVLTYYFIRKSIYKKGRKKYEL